MVASAASRSGSREARATLDLREISGALAGLMAPVERPAGESPYRLQAEIQDVMSKYAPIVRDAPGLQAGLEAIIDLGDRARSCGTGGSSSLAFNPGWHTAIDLRSMLVNAEDDLEVVGEAGSAREAIFEALGVLPKKEKELQKAADSDAEEIAPV
jgi:succinate dehydrogenase/fumarate reductase flavoprotein subunit